VFPNHLKYIYWFQILKRVTAVAAGGCGNGESNLLLFPWQVPGTYLAVCLLRGHGFVNIANLRGGYFQANGLASN